MTPLWLDRDRAIPVDDIVPGSTYETVVVGAGITGNTTAKLSLLQGTVLSAPRGQYSQKIVNAYVEANREGQAWLLRHLQDNTVPFQRRDAYTFSVTDKGADRVRSRQHPPPGPGPVQPNGRP